jgi:hypothetical protein
MSKIIGILLLLFYVIFAAFTAWVFASPLDAEFDPVLFMVVWIVFVLPAAILWNRLSVRARKSMKVPRLKLA